MYGQQKKQHCDFGLYLFLENLEDKMDKNKSVNGYNI